MIVTFNPMINNSASADAALINFYRCVTAACTADVGAIAGAANSTPTTTNLSVVPYLNNSGSQDVSKNCIISVDANTEAGGWITSSNHTVPTSSTFTAINSTTAYQYKADFYNNSGKATYPYNKLSFYTVGQNTSNYNANPSTVGSWHNNTSSNPNGSGWTTNPAVKMMFGCSANSAWTAGDTYTPVGGSTPDNGGTQTTSFSLNPYSISGNNTNGFYVNNTSAVYKMAVTANYCIIWQQNSSNSYSTGFANTLTPVYATGFTIFAHMMYGGLRETQAWENAYSDNPPWCTFNYVSPNTSPYYYNGSYTYAMPQSITGFMRTINNSGVVSSSASRYYTANYHDQMNGPVFAGNATSYAQYTNAIESFAGPYGSLNGIQCPPWYGIDDGVHAPGTGVFPTMPTVDPSTGTLVPSAYPIVVRRNRNDSWNPGGAIRGIYKSLSAPLSTLKLYWGSANQTFTIGNDQYMPVVFGNGDMFLIRYA